MKKLLSITVILTTLFTFSTNARTNIQVCEGKKLTKKEKVTFKARVKSESTYKSIKLINPEKIYIKVSSCSTHKSNLSLSYLVFNNILGKKCSISSINFSFLEIDNKIVYDKVLFGNEKILPSQLSRNKIKLALEKVAQDSAVNPFFSTNNFCQIQYDYSPNHFNWVIQLRNDKGKFCYVQSSLNGNNIKIIKKLYAKLSEC